MRRSSPAPTPVVPTALRTPSTSAMVPPVSQRRPASAHGQSRRHRCRHNPARPLGACRRRPLPRDGLRDRARHVLALCRRDLLRAAAHAVRDGGWRPRGRDRPVRGALLHRHCACAGCGRDGTGHRPLRLAQRRDRRTLRGQLRQARAGTRPAHGLEGRQPQHGAAGAAGQAGGRRPRFVHIDGEHSRAALSKDLELATAVLAAEGVIVLDDMLHPGYPTLMVAVHEYLERHPEMCVLCIIDRETVVAATKFVLCRVDWFKRYEERLLEAYRDNVWPLGADFEPHAGLALSLDTRLADTTR